MSTVTKAELDGDVIYLANVVAANASAVMGNEGALASVLSTEILSDDANIKNVAASLQADFVALQRLDAADLAAMRADFIAQTAGVLGLEAADEARLETLVVQDVKAILDRNEALTASMRAQYSAGLSLILSGVDAAQSAVRADFDAKIAALTHVITGEGELTRRSLTDVVNAATERAMAAIAGGQGDVSGELAGLRNVISRELNSDNGGVGNPLKFISAFLANLTTEAKAGISPALLRLAVDVNAASTKFLDAPADDVGGSVDGLTDTFRSHSEKRFAETQKMAKAMGYDVEDGKLPVFEAGIQIPKEWLKTVGIWLVAAMQIHQFQKEYTGIDAVSVMEQHLPFLAGVIEKAARATGETMMHGIEALHSPMKTVMRGGAELVFNEVEGQLDALGRVTPDNVMDHAAAILAMAGAWGASAHLAAVIAEKSHRGKHLGFPQLAAFMADLAAFQGIARDTFGNQVDAALRSPARRHALERFRGELPDPMTATHMLYVRKLNAESWAKYWAEHGLSDEWIDGAYEAVWQRASPRELAMVFEDGDLDTDWATRMLQRAGFADEAVPHMLKGILSRATKSPRQSYLGAVEASLLSGLTSEDAARAQLTSAGVGAPTIDLTVAAAREKRRHQDAERARALYETMAADGVLTVEDLRAALTALGYDAAATSQAILRANTRRETHLLVKEKADVETHVRKAQIDSIAALRSQFRRLLIGEDQLRAGLSSLTMGADEVNALVSLARADLVPVPKLAEVLTAERRAQEDQKAAQRAVLALQEKGQLTFGESVTRQVALGIADTTARAEAGIVAAKLAPDVTPPKPPTPTGAENARRVAATTMALDLFRAGNLTHDQLESELKKAGQPSDVAHAMADREVARRAADAERSNAERNVAELRRQRKAIEDEGTRAFEAHRLDEHQLLEVYVAAGRAAATAQAMVNDAATRRSITGASKAGASGPAEPALI